MNTPKEKAQELVEKMRIKQPYPNKKTFAKQCALIAVDELIDSHLVLTTTHDLKPSIRCKTYWQQVKNEINLL